LLENLHRVLHGFPVGAGTHDDADLNSHKSLKCDGQGLHTGPDLL
jgi:hypothetical protein